MSQSAQRAAARILVVEDEPDLRQILKMHITAMGFDVLDCEDGSKALDLLEKEAVDVIISDMVMPKTNGIELLSELRARGSSIPFIILSAFSEKEMIIESLSLGIFDYIEKPFDAASTRALLLEAVRVSHELQKIAGDQVLLPKKESTFGKGHVVKNHEEWIIKRLRTLSKDHVPPQKEDNLGSFAAQQSSDSFVQLKALFVGESLQQLRNAERAVRSMGSNGEAIVWELGYLQRVMLSIEEAALVIKEKGIAELARAIALCFAIYRIRKSLLNSNKLTALRKGHKVLELKIRSIFAPADPEIAKVLDEQFKVLVDELNDHASE